MVKGDWCTLVERDLVLVGITLNENEISSKAKCEFKSIVRKSATFAALQSLKLSHTKIRRIMYKHFQNQLYLQSSQFSLEEIAMLFNMRADTVNSYKKCFF